MNFVNIPVLDTSLLPKALCLPLDFFNGGMLRKEKQKRQLAENLVFIQVLHLVNASFPFSSLSRETFIRNLWHGMK